MKVLDGKNILLIVENEAVPFDRRMWNIALSLKEFGAQVTVICPVFGKDSERDTVLEGVHILRYPTTFADGTIKGYLREYGTALVKTTWLLHTLLLRGKRFHLVHVANPPDIFWPLALYLRLFGVKFIFDEHDLSPEAYLSRFEKEEESGGLLYRVQRMFQQLSYRFSHVVISTNESYKAKAIALYPKNSQKLFIVRNGPDLRLFRKRPPTTELKKGRRYMAAYIGVMAIQDGVQYIVDAVDELVNRRGVRDLLVYLIGKGDDWERLRELATSRGLDDVITFTGRIPDDEALSILSTADVCLSPDPYSPLNELSTMTKVMEYMALGKPIVSFNLKESRYSAGEAALYVKNNDAVAFADGIMTLLQDRKLAETMSARGKERILEALSWQKQSEQLLAAYRFALGL